MASKDYDEVAKGYTKAELKKHYKDAFLYYKEKRGNVSVKVLSRKGKVPQSYIRKWMADDDWAGKIVEDGSELKYSDDLDKLANELGLDDNEVIFCYNLLKSRSATTAALKAGYSSSYAHNKAYQLTRKENIQEFLSAIKGSICKELYIDALDVVGMWAKIAFADMTDYVRFGPSGVRLVTSDKVDGQVINEVREGRDGVTVKLSDRMKALDRLSEYMGVTAGDQLAKAKLDLLSAGGEDQSIEINIVRKSHED